MKLKLRPSYANVTSTLALIMATSGAAYAATLPRNSVGTPQLKKDAVVSAKIKPGGVKRADLAGDVVNTMTVIAATQANNAAASVQPTTYYTEDLTIQSVTTANSDASTALELGSVKVPPDTYFVAARVRAFSSDGFPVGISCTLDGSTVSIVNSRTDGGPRDVAITGVLVNSDSFIDLDCYRNSNGQANPISVDFALTAVRVQTP